VNEGGEAMGCKFVGVLSALVALLLSWPSAANQLTFYTNEAAWLAAVSAYQVGVPPTETITRSDYLTTYFFSTSLMWTATATYTETNTSDVWGNGTFVPTFFADFSSAGNYVDRVCFDGGCYAPGLTETDITFSRPIFGFAGFGTTGVHTTLDGQNIPYVDIGFFGVVGNISTLDFQSGGQTEDELDNRVVLDNVVLATIPEPATLVSLLTASLLFFLNLYIAPFRKRLYSIAGEEAADYDLADRGLLSRRRERRPRPEDRAAIKKSSLQQA
jgi:hypothetical protein